MSLILCRQEPVRHPFYIERLGIHIASSQELCYVIYQNPLLVLDGFVDDRLIEFIRSELGLSFLAGKLEAWQRSGESQDELPIVILQLHHQAGGQQWRGLPERTDSFGPPDL